MPLQDLTSKCVIEDDSVIPLAVRLHHLDGKWQNFQDFEWNLDMAKEEINCYDPDFIDLSLCCKT